MEATAALGVSLTAVQVRQFDELRRLLQEWSSRLNLTAIRDTDEIELKHFADSLAPAAHGWRALDGRQPDSLLDVGSGAGFPALPMAIAYPEIRVAALEKRWKKCEFISLAASQLGLNVMVVSKQAETEGRQPVLREKFDLVVARAVAYLPTLAEICIPFTKIGGYFVAMKSESLEEEVADGIAAVEHLGGRLREPIPYELPGLEGTRWLLVAEKIARTPLLFPREPGIPARKPITEASRHNLQAEPSKRKIRWKR